MWEPSYKDLGFLKPRGGRVGDKEGTLEAKLDLLVLGVALMGLYCKGGNTGQWVALSLSNYAHQCHNVSTIAT